MIEEIESIEMDNIGDEMVYSDRGRELLLDEEEISAEEDAFMEGYERAFD